MQTPPVKLLTDTRARMRLPPKTNASLCHENIYSPTYQTIITLTSRFNGIRALGHRNLSLSPWTIMQDMDTMSAASTCPPCVSRNALPLADLGTDDKLLDRLPTVSAAEALEGLHGDSSPHLSTGLPDLDRALTGRTPAAPDEDGGLSKGQITEIWGPPGVGKTAVGIQAAVNVLRAGKSVVWVDCFHPVCHERFTAFYNATRSKDNEDPSKSLDKLVHYTSPTLAHFIALLCRPTPSSVPSDTALVVVDSLSALINHAFPRIPAHKGAARANQGSSNRTVPRQALC